LFDSGILLIIVLAREKGEGWILQLNKWYVSTV
jgi:hypothetical protein